MGFQDRDYNRDSNDVGGVQLPQTMVGMIILVNVVIFVVDALWKGAPNEFGQSFHPLNHWMSLPSDIISRPWGLLTYGFAHAPLGDQRGIWHILLNMYSLWLFGRDVERIYGPKEFIRTYLVFIVLSGLVWALVSSGSHFARDGVHVRQSQLIGASGAVSGILVLFVLHFPHRKFLMFPIPFQVPAWLLCTFIIGMDVYGALGYGGVQDVAFMAHLAGAAAAFLYYRSGIRFSKLIPSIGMPSALSGSPNLKVHKPSRYDEQLESQADAILKKVHQNGADSITAKERKILDEYSRSVREKRR